MITLALSFSYQIASHGTLKRLKFHKANTESTLPLLESLLREEEDVLGSAAIKEEEEEKENKSKESEKEEMEKEEEQQQPETENGT